MGHILHIGHPIDRMKFAPSPVVVEQWGGLVVIGFKPGPHRFFVVVAAAIEFRAAANIALAHLLGAFELVVFEGGPPREFELLLTVVDSETNAQILRWIERGHSTGRYPGLQSTEKYRVLDRVPLRLLP